jgi:hypothetical protein
MIWQIPLMTSCVLLLAPFSCSQHTMSRQTIEYLGFEGCPNTPQLLVRLHAALPDATIIEVDLMKLDKGDPRLGWGAPTILLDGKDLFGSQPIDGGSVSCRNWSAGLPDVDDIQLAMKNNK